MKTIIQRYLGGNLILPFLISLIFFISFLLTFQLFRITKLVINKGVPILAILEMMGHIAISFLPMAIPLAILFSTIYTLNKMSTDSEFLVMRSFGLSIHKLFAPFMVIGIMIAIVTYLLNQSVVPLSKRQFRVGLTVLTSKGFLASIREGQFFTDIPNITLFAEKVINKGKDLEKVFIHHGKDGENVIFAERGKLIKETGNKWGVSTLKLKLSNGNIMKTKNDIQGGVEKILFKEYLFPIFQNDLELKIATKDSMRTTQKLYQMIKQGNYDPIKKTKKYSDKDFRKTRLEYFTRINTSLQCFLFIMVGFCLGVQRARGRTQKAGLLCLIFLVVYYATFFTGVSSAIRGRLPEYVAVYLPTVLGFLFSFKLYRDLTWSS